MNTLDYTKMILQKVSFNVELFRKELKKALNSLVKPEAEALRKWALENYFLLASPVV